MPLDFQHKKFLYLLTLALTTLVLLIMIWGLNKGIDLKDEGFNLAYVANPDAFRFRFSYFDYIIHGLFGWLNPNVMTFRWIALFLNLAGGAVFAWGFCNWLKCQFKLEDGWPNYLFIYSIILLGHLQYYSHFPRSIQYNNTNAFFIACGAGLILFLLSAKHPDELSGWKARLAALGFGGTVAGVFYVKFSSAAPFLALGVCAIYFILRQFPNRERLKLIGWVILGMIIGSGLFHLFFLSPGKWLDMFSFSIDLELKNAHKGSKLALKYWISLVKTGSNLSQFFPYLIIWALFALMYRHARPSNGTAKTVLLCILLLSLYLFYNQMLPYVRHGIWVPFPFFVILTSALAAYSPLYSGRLEGRSLDALGVGLFLFFVPFAGSFGTANPVFFGTLPYLAAWFALILVLFLSLEFRSVPAIGPTALLLVTVAMAVQMLFHNYVTVPRGTPALRLQKYAVEGLTTLEGLRLTKQTAAYFDKLNNLLRTKTNFKVGDQILSIYGSSTVVYALGGISPGIPWHFKKRTKLNCAILKSTPIDRQRLLIFLSNRPKKPYLRCLRRLGIKFPQNYKFVGKAYNTKVYQPKAETSGN